MPTKEIAGRVFDARPDRVDLRDRVYSPKLVSLPESFPEPRFIKKYLDAYTSADLVLNQENEGACTGFGLAAVIDFLLWKGSLEAGGKRAAPTKVSARMCYHLARVYDEWPGEDYEGSSCRGAMKGWHRHGVCLDATWPYRNKEGKVAFVAPKEGWQEEAAARPLGAYYRVDKASVADIQSAVAEVGAVYGSAEAHAGWERLAEGDGLPMIRPRPKGGSAGGHAFAIVGYTPDGFIVQNSWGPKWGFRGFAVLPYEDWAVHAMDSWVAVLGAPVRVDEAARTRSTLNLRERAAGMASWSWRGTATSERAGYANPKVEPLSEDRAYGLTVVLGNNGRPIDQFVDTQDALEAVAQVAEKAPARWFADTKPKKQIVALYAHGGLNNEEASIKRVRVMAPYFLENGIYPIFITWKTGVLESLIGRLEDTVSDLMGAPVRGLGDRILEALSDARDRTIEFGAQHFLVKGLWTEMKQNAEAGADAGSGLTVIADALKRLSAAAGNIEFHAMGHSAGSIVLGHMLPLLKDRGLSLTTCRLFAPACTVALAGEKYVPAMADGTLGSLKVDLMDDERERADSVGAYGKSLLYLVSRALEDAHKMPILGMERAWTAKTQTDEYWLEEAVAGMKTTIKALTKAGATYHAHTKDREFVSNGREKIRLAHGSFDNDVEVITSALCDILGRKTLPTAVECLAGF